MRSTSQKYQIFAGFCFLLGVAHPPSGNCAYVENCHIIKTPGLAFSCAEYTRRGVSRSSILTFTVAPFSLCSLISSYLAEEENSGNILLLQPVQSLGRENVQIDQVGIEFKLKHLLIFLDFKTVFFLCLRLAKCKHRISLCFQQHCFGPIFSKFFLNVLTLVSQVYRCCWFTCVIKLPRDFCDLLECPKSVMPNAET